MTKKFTTIEHHEPTHAGRRVVLPVLGIAVSLLALLWIGEHWAGDCLTLRDAFTLCEVHTKLF